jgi:hypothetical protein
MKKSKSADAWEQVVHVEIRVVGRWIREFIVQTEAGFPPSGRLLRHQTSKLIHQRLNVYRERPMGW